MQIATAEHDVNPPPWMQCPKIQTEFPSLAYIYALDELIVAERRDTLHDIIGIEGIGYTIFNNEGQKVFLAVLEKRFKKFHVKIFNNYGNEVIHVKRPFQMCANSVLVWAPPGNLVGSVKETTACYKTFMVQNRYQKNVLKIVAQRMFEYVYQIQLVYGDTAIGFVKNQWERAAVLDINMKNFGVSFPAELDVRDKAVLLGAGFLIGRSKY